MKDQEMNSYKKYKKDFLKSLSKLNQQIQMNERELDKIDTEGVVHQLGKNKMNDEDEIYQIEMNKEFGGASSSMVRTFND